MRVPVYGVRMSLDSVPLYCHQQRTMRIAVFCSHGPGNFLAAVHAGHASEGRFEVCLLVTDRPGIPAIAAATAEGIRTVTYDFVSSLRGMTVEARRTTTDQLHDRMLGQILNYEEEAGSIDLCVLAYRRIIRGALFDYFRDRMVNQHPADLTVLESQAGPRRYTGILGLRRSIEDGAEFTRTSTILASSEMDRGEILVQGPEVWVDRRVDLDCHEQKQKEKSDWPALSRCLTDIASGELRIGEEKWPDGCRQVFYGSVRLPYGGLQLK
jgi:folate-dependent phosphoribosylglycinamide formyltransferase PurN